MKIQLCLLIILLSGKCLSQQIQVAPYIQPGNAPTLSREEKVVIWQTDSIAGNFTVDYGTNKNYNQSASIKFTQLDFRNTHPILYRAILPDLEFDKKYYYRVKLQGKIVAQATFNTRSVKS